MTHYAPRAELVAHLALVARGDRVAFARVYELTHARLLGLAVRMLGSRAAAENVLYESFVCVWKDASDYNATLTQPMTWLISIVRDRCLDVLRSGECIPESHVKSIAGYRDTLTLEALVDESCEPFDLLAKAIELAHMRTCMETLDVSARQSLALAYYQGLSSGEVARQLASPVRSVRPSIRRGLHQLKRCIDTVDATDRNRDAKHSE